MALPFPAYSLSRRRLDEAILASALSFGADLRRGAHAKSLKRRGSRWLAEISGSDALPASSAFLATGKHDLRGWKRPAADHRDLVGFKLHLNLSDDQVTRLQSCVELFLFPGGYAGLALVENKVANLCLVLKRGALSGFGGWEPFFASLLEMPVLGQRLAHSQSMMPRPLAVSAISYGHVQSVSDGLWRLGDQAAVIHSFCGEGIAIALQSARVAAAHYIDGKSAGEYQLFFARRGMNASEAVDGSFATPLTSSRTGSRNEISESRAPPCYSDRAQIANSATCF